jgi:hypothetical protein
MTERANDPESRPRGVIDPAWEDELRRGQEAEGEAGSVEPELALLHLLRHVRQPETLSNEQLDSLWSAIEAEVAPAATPWWRKAWVWWSAPALAAAAVLAVIVIDEGDKSEDTTVARKDERKAESKAEQQTAAAPPAAAPTEAARDKGARAGSDFAMAEEAEEAGVPGAAAGIGNMQGDAKSTGGVGGSNSFEASFAQLAPHGRRAIRGSVDAGLDELRGQLLADARGVTR